MFKEMNSDEMMKVEGGLSKVIRDGLIYDAIKTTVKTTVKLVANTPYERTVTRGGRKYNVKYDGNWRP